MDATTIYANPKEVETPGATSRVIAEILGGQPGDYMDALAASDTTYQIMTYFVPFYFTWTLIEVLSAVLRGAGDAVRPVVIIGLGICLLRILWILTLFQWFHTLLVLSLCYVVSWVVTSTAMTIYYRRGRWMQRANVIVER